MPCIRHCFVKYQPHIKFYPNWRFKIAFYLPELSSYHIKCGWSEVFVIGGVVRAGVVKK